MFKKKHFVQNSMQIIANNVVATRRRCHMRFTVVIGVHSNLERTRSESKRTETPPKVLLF